MCVAYSDEAWHCCAADLLSFLDLTLVCDAAFLVFEVHDLRHLPRNRHRLMPVVLLDC